MSVYGIVLCLYLQLIQFSSGGNVCFEEYRKGLTLSSTSVFRSEHHNSLSSCVKSCVATVSCEAFSYNIRNLVCLYGTAGSEFESITDPNVVASSGQWQSSENENMIFPCTSSTCQQGSECHVMKSGSTVCVITECTESPSITNSRNLPLERTVGQTIGIICDDGFIISGNPQRTCNGNGRWTDANALCIGCDSITHYTTRQRAQDYCATFGKTLLKYNDALPSLVNVVAGRCVTCPQDLVADSQIHYLEDDCIPDIDYMNKEYCTCVFTTTVPNMKIKIQTVFLDLEEGYDFLWIFDGDNQTAPILGKYSGSTEFTLITSASKAFLIFETDSSNSYPGFKLSYSMVSADIVSDTATSLSAPEFRMLLWLDGYIFNRVEFRNPDDTSVDISDWDLDVDYQRVCYNPGRNNFKAMWDTDYCHTYCVNP